MYVLSAIDSIMAQYFWFSIDEMIESALVHSDGKILIDDIKRFIYEKKMQLWVIWDKANDCIAGTMITEFVKYPRKKILSIVILGGVRFDEWKHVISDLSTFARQRNCSSIEFHGRPGWERKIDDLGFKKIHTVLSLPL